MENSSFINWDWLNNYETLEELNYAKHIHFSDPVSVKINGRQNKGIILKPGIT
jgi:hypothetical protein